MVVDKSVLSSIFLSAIAADQCTSIVLDAINQCQIVRKSWKKSNENNATAGARFDYSEIIERQEIDRLNDAMYLAFFERFVEEMKLADAKARSDFVQQAINIGAYETYLR